MADLHHRVIVLGVDGAFRPFGVAPVGTRHELPPLPPWPKDETAPPEFVLGSFGPGDVAGRPNEAVELGVGDGRFVHPEVGQLDAVQRHSVLLATAARGVALQGSVLFGPHGEGAAGNPDHAARVRFAGQQERQGHARRDDESAEIEPR